MVRAGVGGGQRVGSTPAAPRLPLHLGQWAQGSLPEQGTPPPALELPNDRAQKLALRGGVSLWG